MNKAKASARKGKVLEAHDIILYPLISEKAVGGLEKDNSITFIVAKESTKPQIKKAVEEMYKVKIEKIRTVKDMKGRKKAMLRFAQGFKADDVATKLGII